MFLHYLSIHMVTTYLIMYFGVTWREGYSFFHLLILALRWLECFG